METNRMAGILVLVPGLIVCLAQLAIATPMDTAFTYQGRLIDANVVADGLYGLQFKLFDDPNIILGNQVGSTIDMNEVYVADGYFTMDLDFGDGDPNVFYGAARWLQIGVRPGELDDPNEYVILLPRQRITATPYALFAWNGMGGGAGPGWIFSGDNMYSAVSGNVGIGTTTPWAELHLVGGKFRVNTSEIGGYAVEIDGNKIIGECQGCPPGADRLHLAVADNQGSIVMVEDGGNVGIGTTNPGAKLEVSGQVKIAGGSPGAGKVLTSDDSGLATWQTPGGVTSGTIVLYAGSSAPSGWFICDGTPYSQSSYPELFSVIGYQYGGSGDGFRVPDLRGRGPIGYNAGDPDFDRLGKEGGEKTHRLAIGEMPQHNHGIDDPRHGHSVTAHGHAHSINDPGHSHRIDLDDSLFGGGGVDDAGESAVEDTDTDSATTNISVRTGYANVSINTSGTGISVHSNGGDASHNNLQPYIVLNYIIKH